MNINLIFKTAIKSLNKHKTRSLLTTLGIIVGVVSIIAVMSIGEGAKYKVQKEIEKLGTNFIIVIGSSPKRLINQRAGGANLTLKPSDYKAIMQECEDIALASPGIQRSAKVVAEGQNWQPNIGGITEHYLEIRQWALEKGIGFTEQDVKGGKKFAIIGQTVKRELFGSIDPIGKTIRIKKIPFKVIGVLTEKGKTPDGRDEDDLILIPLKAAQKKVFGIQNNNFMAILLSAKSKERINQAANDIRGILRQQHKLNPEEDDDFTIFTQTDISQASDAATKVLNLLLLIIASISLIVGGIGIMNIMLVTVSERTKEIGIRMALGATTQAILRQFIFEAIIICLMGGFMGISFGILIAKSVGFFLNWPIFISLKALLISLSSSILIGLFFGFYPAKMASNLDPVEALAER